MSDLFLIDVHGVLIPRWWCNEAREYAHKHMGWPKGKRSREIIDALPEEQRNDAWMKRHQFGAHYAQTSQEVLGDHPDDKDHITLVLSLLLGRGQGRWAFYSGGNHHYVRQEIMAWAPTFMHQQLEDIPFAGRLFYHEPDKPDPHILRMARNLLPPADKIFFFDDEYIEVPEMEHVPTSGPRILSVHLMKML